MKIGVIGTGNMGRALGLGWASRGHDVFFGSRDARKAEAIAASREDRIQAGDFDGAAAFGEVILYTVRDVWPTNLLRDPKVLSGKIVIDCNNSAEPPDFHFPPPVPSFAERLAESIPEARVVKAFNTVAARLIELGPPALVQHRISVFLCSESESAKTVTARLAEDLGFVAVDSGKLKHARLVETVADFVRFQM